MTVADLSMFDVVPSFAHFALVLVCTHCGWNEELDPGGPTLTSVVQRAEDHLRNGHFKAVG